jgi:phosphate transport system substrate-binding protein
VRLPLDFRFRSGSSSLDNKGLDDLDRVSSFVASPQYAGQSILLLGFADSSGGPEVNQRLSADRARAVAEEFRTRGVRVAEVIGFGSERPVASNNTAEGREKNRRVEVWLRR